MSKTATAEYAREKKNKLSALHSDEIEAAKKKVQDSKQKIIAMLDKKEIMGESIIENSKKNIRIILENDPDLKGKIRFNTFTETLEPDVDIIWRKEWMDIDKTRAWDDDDTHELEQFLDEEYGVSNESGLRKVLSVVSLRNTFHPIREYFDNLKWDGQPRVERFLNRHLGALDTELNREISKMFFKGAVARILFPGIKYDLTLALIGSQGRGKSWLFSKMAGAEYFTDSIGQVGDTNSYQALLGRWIVELGEGAATKNADIERVKNYLTAQQDVIRLPYSRSFQTFKRQNVFIVTANDEKHLKDTTGNRRYLPVKVEMVEVAEEDIAANIEQWYIDQVWAEALQIYEKDNSLIMPEHTLDELERVRRDNTDFIIDPEDLKSYLNIEVPKDWRRSDIEYRRDYITRDGSDSRDPRRHSVRNTICLPEIIEELLEYDNWRDMKTRNKKGYNELLNQMKQTEGWRQAHPIHGDSDTKWFGDRYKSMRTYFVRENIS